MTVELYRRVETGWRSLATGLVVPVVDQPATLGPWSALVSVGTSGGSGPGPVDHGSELTIDHVGPWALQGVSPGAEALQTMPLPSRGYWKMDEPAEYAPSTPYAYNNSPTNRGGIVPAGGLVIDGEAVPAGTVVVQFRDFSAGDFSAQGQGGSYLFRGCRFRADSIGQSSQFNDFTSTYTNRLLYCDMGGQEPVSLETWQMSFWKTIGGQNALMKRCYCSNQYVTFQMNVPGARCEENFIERLTWYYGEEAPPGQGGEPLHMSSVGSQGGVSGLRVLRNKILCQSPDPLGTVFTQGAALTFGNDIDVPWSDVWIKDNYLSGMGFVIRLFGEVAGQNNLQVTGNRVSTRWFTNGGASGTAQLGDHPVVWGENGNVKADNLWADDYGTGGDGATPVSARQYPAGDGPRVGQTAF